MQSLNDWYFSAVYPHWVPVASWSVTYTHNQWADKADGIDRAHVVYKDTALRPPQDAVKEQQDEWKTLQDTPPELQSGL